MSNFTEKDVTRMTWEEFDSLIEGLISQITDSGVRVDVVAPLLRTGGIVGGVLAIKMHVFTMLPVQFKYSYNPTSVRQITSVPDVLVETPRPMNILLCEGNTNSGSSVTKAATAIKEKYPDAKIYLATITKVFGGPEKLDGVERIFYGRMTNESFKASTEEQAKFNLRPGITIFPWERAEDELADINA